MTESLRSLIAAVAILATVLGAGLVGAMRGQAAEAQRIVICSGQDTVTLSLDADGNPTGPSHWCPDCVVQLLAGLATPPQPAEAPLRLSRAVPAPPSGHPPGRALPAPPARGPPLG